MWGFLLDLPFSLVDDEEARFFRHAAYAEDVFPNSRNEAGEPEPWHPEISGGPYMRISPFTGSWYNIGPRGVNGDEDKHGFIPWTESLLSLLFRGKFNLP